MIQSFTLPLHRCIVFTTFIFQVLAIMIGILRYVLGSLILSLYRCAAILPLRGNPTTARQSYHCAAILPLRRGDLLYISSAFPPTLAACIDHF
jgi:hypothetical protein